MINLDFRFNKIIANDKAKLRISRSGASLVSMHANFIFISGGMAGVNYTNYHLSAFVERYNSLLDKWEVLPSLYQARVFHSSCIIRNTMYVVGGRKKPNQELNSIEKLNNIDVSNSQDSFGW